MKILVLARISNSFTGDTIYKKPLGGSESALFYMAKELAALGHDVHIFGNCDTEGCFEGVNYKRFSTLKQMDGFSRSFGTDIFISFRDLPAFLYPMHAKKKIWWGHDDFSNMWNLPYPKKIAGLALLRFGGFLANKLVDKFFVPSKWLGDICMKELGIKKEKIYETRNGVELGDYTPSLSPPLQGGDLPAGRHGVPNPERSRGGEGQRGFRLIYASVPDRGLDILLDIFPEIKKAVPEAELHVFCGFDLGMIKRADKERAQRIYPLTNQSGVLLRGTVTQKELAEEFKRSRLLVYPTHELLAADFYAETSCIVALQAQAAGTPVISSHRGAMPETVKHGSTGVLIKGDPFSRKYKEEFVSSVVELLKDPEKWSEMSQNARKHAFSKYSWAKIAAEWQNEFVSMLKERK
jgi:glycosyltransferase involved in cell wall biosynthesis